MIPRQRLDIGWRDLAYGLASCVRSPDVEASFESIARAWLGGRPLVTLSVRSGFDSVLEAHGRAPVPVDLRMSRLSVAAGAIDRAVTPRTRGLLVAHLFGSRMPMEPLVGAAHERGLLGFEDAAQATVADG